MSDDTLIVVDGVSKKFCRHLKKSLWYGLCDTVGDLTSTGTERQRLREAEFWANRDISISIRRGDRVGILGHNGAGKTTLLKMLNGLIKPDQGTITMRGRVGALIALGAGFNPILTGRENVFINGAVLGLSRQEIESRFDEIVDFAELDEFIDSPVQNYSSGMQVRLGFAVAATLNPDILLVDEVLAVGDLAFRNKCLRRMKQFGEKGGVVILVSHQIQVLQALCDRGIVLSQGMMAFDGTMRDAVHHYVEEGKKLNQTNQPNSIQKRDDPLGKEITISSAAAMGTTTSLPQTGEGFTISIKYHARTAVHGIVPHIVIHSADMSNQIATLASSDAGKKFDLPAGTGVIEVDIPPLFLRSKEYAVVVRFMDANIGFPVAQRGVSDPPDRFTLESAKPSSFIYPGSLNDILDTAGTWRSDSAVASAIDSYTRGSTSSAQS
ncbi:MAG: polysaccharide ABC transporter ATP-binding protein [Verrucomicrobiota bacterium]